MIFNKILRNVIKKAAINLGIQIQKYTQEIAKSSLPEFSNNPKNLTIELPRRIINPERMFFGDDVSIGPQSFFIAMKYYPSKTMQNSEGSIPVQNFDSKIIIGNRVTATSDLQIAAQSEIIIEDDVMFASNVHINDGSHGYENSDIPYKFQPISNILPIKIKRGCWIGQNVMIMPGVTIGELSIIGANSMVRESIPDRCIAVGVPAKVIKKWDEAIKSWV